MTAAGYSSREARAREFVAGLPTAGSVIFVQDRYGQQAVRDLVILTHGVRVNEATSIFVASRPEDEAQHLVENRRPVFRHPDLIDFRSGITTTAPVDDRPCVPRRGPNGDEMGGAYTPIVITGPAPITFAEQPLPPDVRPAALDTMRNWSGLASVAGTALEPEGDLVIATISIIRDRRSGRPYLVQAPSVRRGTFMEVHDTLDAAIAALPAVARRVIGVPRA